MCNVNETDYKNALDIIKKCKSYVEDEIKDIKNNADFDDDYKLLLLDKIDNYYHRGGCKVWLTLNRRGLATRDFCGDGSTWGHDIHTSEKPYTYAYNDTKQKTIELAVKIAKHWEYIKDNIRDIKKKYIVEKENNSNILATFSI